MYTGICMKNRQLYDSESTPLSFRVWPTCPNKILQRRETRDKAATCTFHSGHHEEAGRPHASRKIVHRKAVTIGC